MSDARNDLLLAALRRARQRMTSGDVLDAAMGLAKAEGWTAQQLAPLNRKSVSKRLQNMADAGVINVAGAVLDGAARRMTPTYAAPEPNENAWVPPPPAAPMRAPKDSPYEGLEKSQLIVLLDVHDDLAQIHTRKLASEKLWMDELERWREKSRARLAAVGLGN